MVIDASKVEAALAKTVGELARGKSDPKVVGARFVVVGGPGGDDTIAVTVVLDDATRDEDWTSPHLEPIAARFRTAVWNEQPGVWTVVRFARSVDFREVA